VLGDLLSLVSSKSFPQAKKTFNIFVKAGFPIWKGDYGILDFNMVVGNGQVVCPHQVFEILNLLFLNSINFLLSNTRYKGDLHGGKGSTTDLNLAL
jgi:hypothetical protein